MNSSSAPDPVAQSWLELPDGRPFWLRDRVTVGRQADNDLVLDAHTVSRHHALVALGDHGFTVSDLHSSNGSYLNDAPLTRVTPLRDGDAVRFGDVVTRFRCTRPSVIAPLDATTLPDRNRRFEDTRERACWLLLADIAGWTRLNSSLGPTVARQHFQAWITGIKPLIERAGGTINTYVGDAIFAWWPADTAAPATVRDAFARLARWQDESPVRYRLVLHHGPVLFTRRDRGEELSGQEVNFLFAAETLAKRFATPSLLSEAAVHSLELDGKCPPLGNAELEGIRGRFVFFGPPRSP